jgi:NAD(P)-dependent dehydrogenase (short-subunit alcohol dehydrogenase family)
MDTPLFGREVARDWAERFEGASAEQKLAANRSESLLDQLVDPEDIAELCCFLLSRATRAVTGQVYPAWGAPLG